MYTTTKYQPRFKREYAALIHADKPQFRDIPGEGDPIAHCRMAVWLYDYPNASYSEYVAKARQFGIQPCIQECYDYN